MDTQHILPNDPLAFIQDCVRNRRVVWTWHINMRLEMRMLSRRMILDAVESYEVIEAYPQDKYYPSYLVHARGEKMIFHVLFGADVPGSNVRVITAYIPEPAKWDADLKRRNNP